MAKETNNKYEIMAESSVNIQTDVVYASDAERIAGVVAGVARSILYNTAARQNSKIAVAIANFMARKNPLTDIDTILTTEQLDALLEDAIKDAAASGPGSQVITVTYVSAGRYVANITPYVFNDQNKLTLKFVGTVPSADLELPAKFSVDNGVIDYALKLKDTLNAIPVSEVQAQIADTFRDGTEAIINRTFSSSKILTFDSITNSIYELLNAVKGTPEIVDIDGLLLNQECINGDVAGNVTTDDNGTRIGINDDGTILTSNGYSATERTFNIISGHTYIIIGKFASTSVGRICSEARLIYSDSSVQTSGSTSDSVLRTAQVITANASLLANIKFRETVAYGVSGVLNKSEVYLIDITNTPLHSHTAPQIDNIVQEYFEGIDYITDFELQSIGLNGCDSELELGAIDADGSLSASNKSVRSVNYYPVKMVIDYIYKFYSNEFTVNGDELFVVEYDASENFIQRVGGTYGGDDKQFETISNTSLVKLYIYQIKDDDTDLTSAELQDLTAQLEEGTTASEYVAYNSPQNFKLTNTDGSDLDLLSVGTSVRDKAYYYNGKWWKDAYVGYDYNDVFKNDMDWNNNVLSVLTNTHIVYHTTLDTLLGFKSPSSDSVLGNGLLIIDGITFGLTTVDDLVTDDIENTFAFDSDGALKIRVNKTTYVDGDAWETHVNASDVTFVYELDTPLDPVELEKDGSVIQESNTTLVQIGNSFATEYRAKFAVNSEATVLILVDKVIYLQEQDDKKEIEIEELQLKAGKSIMESATSIVVNGAGPVNVNLTEALQEGDILSFEVYAQTDVPGYILGSIVVGAGGGSYVFQWGRAYRVIVPDWTSNAIQVNNCLPVQTIINFTNAFFWAEPDDFATDGPSTSSAINIYIRDVILYRGVI